MEFIFENPWLLFIVIGIITSIFNKLTGNQGKQKSRPQRQPIQPQKGANHSTSSPIREVKKNEALPAIPKKVINNIEKEYAERKKQAEETLHSLKDKQRALENKTQSLLAVSERGSMRLDFNSEKDEKPSFLIEKQKLAEGVVWAEILGPPRALNPHKSIRQKR
ncbi:hypothetical protein ACFFHH_09715 [Cytobacillus solani]|uniref:Uncharacterized protein n=1 Tax=Cytobacillus solani TaxID=1637975 RepID=A0A0Q3QSP0_9BACI|nr:hypothetical protein [Cytobacillus solani]KOP83494.1 hypothetical protein AMS60_13965 [Bacillus sp. FJAT-21945]KQL20568.1 hypothetical protein AN957_19580 [Cytobacillus solani]USK53800.1 hypothetical protein LIS82_19630 [Cytobacillus solani]